MPNVSRVPLSYGLIPFGISESNFRTRYKRLIAGALHVIPLSDITNFLDPLSSHCEPKAQMNGSKPWSHPMPHTGTGVTATMRTDAISMWLLIEFDTEKG